MRERENKIFKILTVETVYSDKSLKELRVKDFVPIGQDKLDLNCKSQEESLPLCCLLLLSIDDGAQR